MLRQAFDALAALPVAGVTSFTLDALPETLERAHLPALLILPHESAPTVGLSVDTFGGAHHILIGFTHLLVWTPARASAPIRKHIAALVDSIDAYLTALASDLMLGGLLAQPPQVRVEIGVFEYGGVHFLGCAFRHSWLMPVVTP